MKSTSWIGRIPLLAMLTEWKMNSRTPSRWIPFVEPLFRAHKGIPDLIPHRLEADEKLHIDLRGLAPSALPQYPRVWADKCLHASGEGFADCVANSNNTNIGPARI